MYDLLTRPLRSKGQPALWMKINQDVGAFGYIAFASVMEAYRNKKDMSLTLNRYEILFFLACGLAFWGLLHTPLAPVGIAGVLLAPKIPIVLSPILLQVAAIIINTAVARVTTLVCQKSIAAVLKAPILGRKTKLFFGAILSIPAIAIGVMVGLFAFAITPILNLFPSRNSLRRKAEAAAAAKTGEQHVKDSTRPLAHGDTAQPLHVPVQANKQGHALNSDDTGSESSASSKSSAAPGLSNLPETLVTQTPCGTNCSHFWQSKEASKEPSYLEPSACSVRVRRDMSI